MTVGMAESPAVALSQVSLAYGRGRKQLVALQGVDLQIMPGQLVGVIGPDGVGKSSLLALIAGARQIQQGRVEVLGGNMADFRHRNRLCPRIAYMPQGLGRNLYATLSVAENLDFFGALFGHDRRQRQQRIAQLTTSTGLRPFLQRPVNQLSGGMKQKLGLCCALIHDPDLLILDEPTTGVDPLSRRQFWQLINSIRQQRPWLTVLVATAYMEEAAHFDRLVAMDAGAVLAIGTAQELLLKTGEQTLQSAFVALLPTERRAGHRTVDFGDYVHAGQAPAIEADKLTMRFGDFTAVSEVSFQIGRGEIFGFVGSNGCGKTTTMKMLTGLLEPSAGNATLFGKPIDTRDLATRYRVGYMSQSFSLYGELSVSQNLWLHARLFQVAPGEIAERVMQMIARFELTGLEDRLPPQLPLGVRQRLSLAVALIHQPEVLILDEPTSGVDPVARDQFWSYLGELSRRDQVTIFISTHFMDEAMRCDRVALMHGGKLLQVAEPGELIKNAAEVDLDAAFIHYIEQAEKASQGNSPPPQLQEQVALPEGDSVRYQPLSVSQSTGHYQQPPPVDREPRQQQGSAMVTKLRRVISFAYRESLELLRDPVRLALALVGNVILLLVMGYGISLDVEDITFAVLDRDQTGLSRDYANNLAGSPYFIERSAISDYQQLDLRMRSGELSLVIEIPPGFGRNLQRGRPVEIGAWIDGSMPTRGETLLGYVQGMHGGWLQEQARRAGLSVLAQPQLSIEPRFRYNPDVRSIVAMVPAVIPLLLMMVPAMLAALSVVREKELGSIINFYVTPAGRLEFLVGKQIPYVVLSMVSFLLLVLFATVVFVVPLKGSFAALAVGALLYVSVATAFGLLVSAFMRSQIAAIFGTAVLTLLPAVSYSGLIDPVTSLQGVGRVIGEVYPTTHFLTIARGTFSKALGMADLTGPLAMLALTIPVLLLMAALALRKQER